MSTWTLNQTLLFGNNGLNLLHRRLYHAVNLDDLHETDFLISYRLFDAVEQLWEKGIHPDKGEFSAFLAYIELGHNVKNLEVTR